jgi:hypothetical protein
MNNKLELENISLKRKLGISEVENVDVGNGKAHKQNESKNILR